MLSVNVVNCRAKQHTICSQSSNRVMFVRKSSKHKFSNISLSSHSFDYFFGKVDNFSRWGARKCC